MKATSASVGSVLVAHESRVGHHRVRRLRRSSPRRSGPRSRPRTGRSSTTWWASAASGIGDTASRWRTRRGRAWCARCRRATPAAGTSSVPSRMCTGIGVMNAARRWRAIRTNLSIMPGSSSIVAKASRPPTQPVSGSVATTVAVRGVSRSKAISPTISPGANSATVDTPSAAGVRDLRPSGFDDQEGHRAFALAHQHLSGRRGQRAQLRRQRHQTPRWGSRRKFRVRRVRQRGRRSIRPRHEATGWLSRRARKYVTRWS